MCFILSADVLAADNVENEVLSCAVVCQDGASDEIQVAVSRDINDIVTLNSGSDSADVVTTVQK